MSAPRDWSLYDAADTLEAVSHRRADGRREMILRIEGMHCQNCVRHIQDAVAPLTRSARVNLSTGTAELVWDERAARASQLFAAVEQAGFTPGPLNPEPSLRGQQRERGAMLLRLGSAGLLGMQVMMLAATQYFIDAPLEPAIELLMRYAQWIMATPVLLYCAWPLLDSAARALRERRVNMDVPVSLALLMAYAASGVNVLRGSGHVYFDSVTMFVFLLLVARWFEGQGRAEATKRLRTLASAQPLTALRESTDGLTEVSSAALAIGDVIVVPPGAALAADGRLLDATAELDESLLTGEADPAVRHAGDAVYAGAVNLGGAPLRLRVSAAQQSTTLSHINRMIHHAQTQQPRVQILADRVAGRIVIAVLLAAAGGVLYWYPQSPETAFQVALAVLVVTCPCALSLATPVVLAAASSRLAASGLLLTRADALLRLPQIHHVCFDKTGTLTTGEMRQVRLWICDGENEARMLEIAAALERGIRHPVATAFAGISTALRAQAQESLPGLGVRGRVDGVEYRLLADPGSDDDLTWIALYAGEHRLARFGLAHALRPEAVGVVQQLMTQGLRVSILSGDSERAVAETAARLGVDDYLAQLKPDQKLAELQMMRAQGERLWMVGDGINDAPTLAAADVSTALASGAALAQSQADLLITGSSLDVLPEALAVAREAQQRIRENLIWAVGYNLAAVPLALMGLVTPWIAALGMGISSVTVVLNALRLARRPATSAADWTPQPTPEHAA